MRVFLLIAALSALSLAVASPARHVRATATNVSESTAFSLLAELEGYGAAALHANGTCSYDCVSLDTLRRAHGSVCFDEKSGWDCLCSTDLSAVQQCTSCLEGNTTDSAKTIVQYCRENSLGLDTIQQLYGSASSSAAAFLGAAVAVLLTAVGVAVM
ncbi:hypothetical protein JCM8547_008323 [Rhodosporidiobolus lusitaniae]